jgi:hypothetical protein
MPFAYYLVWAYAFAPRWWNHGFPAAEQEKEYKEFYELASYLLKTFDNSGKTFLLGHWEGDWHLRPDLNTKTDAAVTPEMLQGMADWLNVRQRAIEDARRKVRHHNVRVYCYTEVNHVSIVSTEGRPSVTNSVLPKTNMDYVSYSTYDSLDDIPGKLPKALDYIDSKLRAKPGIDGKRIFIGEYGFPARSVPEAERDRKSRQVMRVGLQWGCPFVLCWAVYNNEFSEGRDTGFWLIDNNNFKQPLWHTHHNYLTQARRYVADFKRAQNRLPDSREFRTFALQMLQDR